MGLASDKGVLGCKKGGKEQQGAHGTQISAPTGRRMRSSPRKPGGMRTEWETTRRGAQRGGQRWDSNKRPRRMRSSPREPGGMRTGWESSQGGVLPRSKKTTQRMKVKHLYSRIFLHYTRGRVSDLVSLASVFNLQSRTFEEPMARSPLCFTSPKRAVKWLVYCSVSEKSRHRFVSEKSARESQIKHRLQESSMTGLK